MPEAPPPTPKTGRMTMGTQRHGGISLYLLSYLGPPNMIVVQDGMD